jgi:flagellin-like hook-associated protein FlgL
MASIYPVPTTRSSEALLQTRLLAQLQTDQLNLLRLQTQISTGRRILTPSEDAPAAIRGMGLQRLLEQKTQVKTNLTTSASYLTASDVAISNLSGLIASIRGTAVAVADTTASASERQAASVEIDRAIQQILDVSNQQFRGRYLFAGSDTTTRPFEVAGEFIKYVGNEGLLRSFADLDLLFETNVPGSSLFGGLSAERKGTVDLNPVLTPATKLSALRGGTGITKGSIAVSDGVSTKIIDISRAETIGDVAGLIERSAPTGRRVTARVTNIGLEISLDEAGGGNLTVREVGGGSTAAQLGIFNTIGVGTGKIIGQDLNPRLQLTSQLRDVLGTRATAVLASPNLNNDIFFEARERGTQSNGISIQLVDDELLAATPGLSAGGEIATYSATPVAARASVTWGDGPAGENDIIITAAQPGAQFNNVSIVLAKQTGLGGGNPQAAYSEAGGTKTLTITIDDAVDTSLADIKTAIEAIQFGGQPAFTVTDDDSASGGDGTGSVSFLTAPGTLGNTGNSGGDAGTIFVRVQNNVSTAQQVVSALNANAEIAAMFDVRIDDKDTTSPGVAGLGGVSVTASAVTSGGSGIEFDQDSGLQITNGGETHALTFAGAETVEDLLNILNGSQASVHAQINADGTGIDVRSRLSGSDFRIGENGGQTATQLGLRTLNPETRLADLNYGIGVHTADGVDFTIHRNDGVALEIDISSAKTIGDVLNLINQHPDNLDPNTRVVAQLTAVGNGIEIVDDNPLGTGQLSLERAFNSEAAWDLGILPRGQDTALPSDGPPPAAARATIGFSPPNSTNNGLVITANSVGTALNNVQVVFQNVAAVGNQALVNFDAATKTLTIDVDPTATTAATVLGAINAEGTFSAALNSTLDPTNNGLGLILDTGTLGVTAGGSPNPASLPASSAVTFAAPNHLNSALVFTAANPGTAYNGVTIEFINDQVGNVASVAYSPASHSLQIRIDSTQTTANTIRAAVNDHGLFFAELDRSADTTNSGNGLVGAVGVVASLEGGTPETLTGRDPYTVEASGIFNTLMRLQATLDANDQVGIQRAAAMIEDDLERVSFVRADLGAKGQSLDVLSQRLEDESVELTATLSVEIDTDLVEAISNLTARQASFQASLQLMGRTFQLSLLDYL